MLSWWNLSRWENRERQIARGRLDGGLDGWMEDWMEGFMDRRLDGWMEDWMEDSWIGDPMNRPRDGWMADWMTVAMESGTGGRDGMEGTEGMEIVTMDGRGHHQEAGQRRDDDDLPLEEFVPANLVDVHLQAVDN